MVEPVANEEAVRDPLERIARAVAFAGALIAGLALLWVMFAVTLDVVSRNFRGRSLFGVTDRVEAVLVLVVFLAIAYTQTRKEHVSVEAVVNRMGATPQKVLKVLALVVALLVAGYLAWALSKIAVRQYGIREVRIGIAAVPMWPSRIVAAVGAWMWALQYFAAAISALRRKRTDADGVYTYGPL